MGGAMRRGRRVWTDMESIYTEASPLYLKLRTNLLFNFPIAYFVKSTKIVSLKTHMAA